MVNLGLFVRLRAKPGKEEELEQLLKDGLSVAQAEPGTPLWFPDEPARAAHLSGRVAAALTAKAPDLLAETPVIERADVLAAKAA
jgi:quinol monooxygenase YgiN